MRVWLRARVDVCVYACLRVPVGNALHKSSDMNAQQRLRPTSVFGGGRKQPCAMLRCLAGGARYCALLVFVEAD